jgi:hypothetical protein
MARRSAALLVFLAALVAAPSVGAATATVADGTLFYAASAGETNTVSIDYDSAVSGYRIIDATANPKGGPDCGAVGEHEVDCVDRNVTAIVVHLRDGNDKWSGGDIKIAPTLYGGAGDDDLEGIGNLSGDEGNDTLKTLDSGSQLDGGPGNDLVVGGQGDDVIDGGPGDDFLIGNDGKDTLLGNTGLDRIDASGDGVKTVDCQGRDDEIIQGGENVERIDCPPAPKMRVQTTHVSVKRFLSGGLPFSVNCDRPCAVYWELIRNSGGLLGRRTGPVDADGFLNPMVGVQRFVTQRLGKATKRRLKRLRSFRVTLGIQVYGRDGLTTKKFTKLKIG